MTSIYDDAAAKLAAAAAAVADATSDVQAHTPFLDSLGTGLASALNDIVTAQQALTAVTPMPLISGLFVEGSASPVSQVTNTICNVHWSDLQLVANGGLVPNNPIDQWLAKGGVGHVRLFFGRFSPQFAFQYGRVLLSDPQDGLNNIPVPLWWDTRVQALQADCIKKVAAAYDGKISLIFAATPMTIYAEPMMRGSNRSSALPAAGWTEAADHASFDALIQMYSAFKKTRVGVALNPFQTIKSGANASDVAYTMAWTDKFRAAFGERAHIQNNSIRTPSLGGDYATLYAYMAGKKPLGFQTATAARIGDWATTVQWAIDQGAHLVELSGGFQNYLTAAQLTAFDAALKANAPL